MMWCGRGVVMRIQEYIVSIQLPGCDSLKNKRQRLQGLHDRFGKLHNVAVCESDYQDIKGKSQWTFVIVGMEQKIVEQTWSAIEMFLREQIDGYIVGVQCRRM